MLSLSRFTTANPLFVVCPLFVVFILLVISPISHAEHEQLVKDINSLKGTDGQQPYTPTHAFDDLTFFSAFEPATGQELWRTDGSPDGTQLLTDIAPGSYGWDLTYAAELNDIIYFIVSTEGSLWRSDGTRAGTHLLDPNLPRGNRGLIATEQALFFIKENWWANRSDELWISDGTAAGTRHVNKDLQPGTIYTLMLTKSFKGQALFIADSSQQGTELWISDGTPAGTLRLKQGEPNLANPYADDIHDITLVGDTFYFTSSDYKLWVSDGTPAGTRQVKDFSSLANPYLSPDEILSGLTQLNDTLFFILNTRTIWSSDGSLGGTQEVASIAGAFAPHQPPVATNGQIFFLANDPHGLELWKSDGTPSGTGLVKDIYPGSDSSRPSNLTAASDVVYFYANDNVHGRELWVSDGSDAGTQLVVDIKPGSGDGAPMDVYLSSEASITNTAFGLLLQVDDGLHGSEFWVSDGSAAGTTLLADINTKPNQHLGSANPSAVAVRNELLLFLADDGIHGRELWRSDGSEDGTQLVKDILPGGPEDGASFRSIANLDTALLFRADDGVNGSELWRSDGYTDTTQLVLDINPGPASSNSTQVGSGAGGAILGDSAVFSADDGLHGAELWRSDATPTGTRLIKDIMPGGDASNPMNFIAHNGAAYFVAQDARGDGLWKTDGSSDGTVRLLGAYEGEHFLLGQFTSTSQALFFTRLYELWRTDGTENGTYRVQPTTGQAWDSISQMAAVEQLVFFSFYTSPDTGLAQELWRSDGTAAGTFKVATTQQGDRFHSWGFQDMIGFKGQLIFTNSDAEHGSELWVSDGTAAGTHMIKDIVAGPLDGAPESFRIIDDKLYFVAANGMLWSTDGTPAGTVPQLTLYDSVGYYSDSLIVVNDLLFFTGQGEPSIGSELWVTQLPSSPPLITQASRRDSCNADTSTANSKVAKPKPVAADVVCQASGTRRFQPPQAITTPDPNP